MGVSFGFKPLLQLQPSPRSDWYKGCKGIEKEGLNSSIFRRQAVPSVLNGSNRSYDFTKIHLGCSPYRSSGGIKGSLRPDSALFKVN
jgi:hypothetical protein